MIAVYKKFFLMLGVTVLLCLSASVVWSETIQKDKLVWRDGITYKKFSIEPIIEFLAPPKTPAKGITIREIISKISKVEKLQLTKGDSL